MAKAERCWLVREADPRIRPQSIINYAVYIGRRPYWSKGGSGRLQQYWIGKRVCPVSSRAVEVLLPKKYHLNPGAGPVELEG